MKLLFYFCLMIAPPVLAGQAADLLAARDAFRTGNTAKLELFSQRLKNTPLEVYADYYRLRLGLENADANRVKSFLARPEDTPLIDKLRGEWLKQLGKNQQWELFGAEYPRLLNEDVELTCYALQSRLLGQEHAALNEVRGLWFSGKAQPESCNLLFEAALANGTIGEQDVWQRLRLALEIGNVTLAKQLAGKLTGDLAISSAALDSAATDTDHYLEKLTPKTDGQRIVALFALHRLAKQSPDLAMARWEKMSAHFSAAEQQYFYGWLAYEAARKLDSRANQWFKAAAAFNEQQSAWRVRAALRAQDWNEVLTSVNAMNKQQQHEAVWQYWKARALQATGKSVEANRLFAPLSGEYNFYGQLAAEELADTQSLNRLAKLGAGVTSTYKPGKNEIEAMLTVPGIQRTLTLYRMDMRFEAHKEWSWAVRNFNDQELITAAEIAKRNEMYDRAIGAAEKTLNVHDFSLRYLAPYRDALKSHIHEHGLEEAWVYGLMRQESRFVTGAKSGVGAAGLMQIMPSTARWIAKKLGLKNYSQSLIHQIDTNLRLGTYYMKTVLSWFDGSPVLASAAYNAGPGRARLWRGSQALEGAIYAETIPFDETRDYVKKVMSNTMYYTDQFDEPTRPLKQRLGVIAAKTPINQQAIPDEK